MNGLTRDKVVALQKAYSHLPSYGADPIAPIDPLTYQDADGDRLIHIAAFAGDLRAVQWLVDAGEDVSAPGDMSSTPAHYAAAGRHRDVFDLLMARGTDPTMRDEFGQTPESAWAFFAASGQK